MTRKFFQIGFNKCGTTFIERLFRLNGISVRHWEKGALADDIAYSKLIGRAPLQKWAKDTVAFTDMESVRHVNMPVIEAFKEYAFLDQHFPGAVFLLNTRRIEDWINSRYMHLNGLYARACAQSLGVSLPDLAQIWRDDWHAHIEGCRAYFGSRPEFIHIDIDEAQPEDYLNALSPWFNLTQAPELPGDKRIARRESYAAKVGQMLGAPQPGHNVTPKERETVAAALARFAAPRQIQRRDRAAPAIARHVYRFDARAGTVTNSEGEALAIRRGSDGRYYADPMVSGLLATAATANDIAAVTDHGIYDLDMREACRIGTGPQFDSAGPVIAPSRRAGAENVFLWPMPRFHNMGNTAFMGSDPNAFTPPDQREDRAIWQGGLSGYTATKHGPNLNRPTGGLVNQMLNAAKDSDFRDTARNRLRAVNRLAVLRRWQGTNGIDMHLCPDARATKALKAAGMGNLITDQAAPAPLHSHRYVICLGGTAIAEQFLPALNAGAIVLLEEDGWQAYCSILFRAWEHYIPLEYGARDLAERLDWARSNPKTCAAMVERARKACEALADPAGRRLHLTQVLAAYRQATDQKV